MTFLDAGPDRSQIISGAVHYFRVHPDQWRDRLLRLQSMGATTLETYVAWNFHQPFADRQPDFTGMADLGAYLDLAAELDFDVILRPGPYICAEWDFGGLPAWVTNVIEPNDTLRTSSPSWLAVLDTWLDLLLPHIVPRLTTHGGRVIAVQVENEYGSFGNDHAYLRYLADGLSARGVDVPLFTSDGPSRLMLTGGTLPEAIPTVNFGSGADRAFATLEEFRPGTPPMVMEFWNGWFDHWGAPEHALGAPGATEELQAMLAAGQSVNFYMAHGGTSFGTWSGANAVEEAGVVRLQPTVTSYDYDAPIAEDGTLTAKYDAFRAVIAAHRAAHGQPALPEPPPPPVRLSPQSVSVDCGPSLSAVLDAAAVVSTAVPQSMERLGLHHGVVRYRTAVAAASEPVTITLDGLADLARITLDDQVALVAGLTDDPAYGPSAVVSIPVDTTIDVVVHSLGRINYGPHYARFPKGLRQIRVEHQQQFGLEQAAVDLTTLPDLAGLSDLGDDAPRGPGFYRAEIVVDAPADGFLALPGWHLGYVYLNGFNLGRYWSIGPTRTLYAPQPLWRAGANTVTVCELDSPGERIELVDGPDLGPVAR